MIFLLGNHVNRQKRKQDTSENKITFKLDAKQNSKFMEWWIDIENERLILLARKQNDINRYRDKNYIAHNINTLYYYIVYYTKSLQETRFDFIAV